MVQYAYVAADAADCVRLSLKRHLVILLLNALHEHAFCNSCL